MIYYDNFVNCSRKENHYGLVRGFAFWPQLFKQGTSYWGYLLSLADHLASIQNIWKYHYQIWLPTSCGSLSQVIYSLCTSVLSSITGENTSTYLIGLLRELNGLVCLKLRAVQIKYSISVY